ncbi:MAG: polymer-forming cytoskeletal protein [Desulfatibacillaceae bacterium]
MKKKGGINTFLGPDVTFEGELRFEGSVRVDGTFKGTIESQSGLLIVGEKALVEGDIHVGKVMVAGKVQGGIVATDSVEIQKSGQMVGDITAPKVTIDSGALFHGNCAMEGGSGGLKALPGPEEDDGIEIVRQKSPFEGGGRDL